MDLPPERPSKGKYLRNMAIALLVGMPLALFGVLLCMSVIGLPLGIPALILSAWPAYVVEQRYEKKLHAWKERDHPLFEEDDIDYPRPWEEEGK